MKHHKRTVFLAILFPSLLCIHVDKARASMFGEETAVLLKIMAQNIIQNATLHRILGVAHEKLSALKGILGTFKKIFGGTDLPHDYISWEGHDLNEIAYQGDVNLERVLWDVWSAKDVDQRIRNIPFKDILHGKNLEQLVYVIKDAWDLTAHFPDDRLNKQDAIGTLVALQSLDAGRRSYSLLPEFNDSLQSILPEINTATPGRAIQLNTHLNFLQTAGVEHILENQTAETRMAAIELLNKQEKEKENLKTTKVVYSALAEAVSKELKPK